MKQFRLLGAVLLGAVVALAAIILASGQVQGVYNPEIRYYPRGQDPGQGPRLVGCCEYTDTIGRHRTNDFGFCHLLAKETNECKACCKDMGQRPKSRYYDFETDCECV